MRKENYSDFWWNESGFGRNAASSDAVWRAGLRVAFGMSDVQTCCVAGSGTKTPLILTLVFISAVGMDETCTRFFSAFYLSPSARSHSST